MPFKFNTMQQNTDLLKQAGADKRNKKSVAAEVARVQAEEAAEKARQDKQTHDEGIQRLQTNATNQFNTARGNISNAYQQANFGAGDTTRRELAGNLVKANQGVQSRGLLYGGIARQAQGDQVQAAQTALANRVQQNADKADSQLQDAKDTAFAGLYQDTEGKFQQGLDALGARQNKDLRKNQALAELGQGGGALVGAGLGLL